MRAIWLFGAFVAGILAASSYYWAGLLPWGPEAIYLIVSGGLGGLAYSLTSRENLVRFPHWAPADADKIWSWDPGFLADVFIGMLGAVASLVFGLAVLNREFFGAVQSNQPESAIPPWARLMAFGTLAGFASRQLLPGLSKRLEQMISEKVDDKVAKSEKKTNNRLEIVSAEAEAARLTAKAAETPADVVVVTQAAQRRVAAATQQEGDARLRWVRELQELLTEYRGVNFSDHRRRVKEREKLADAMLNVLKSNNVDSQQLLNEVRNETNGDWMLPLATLITVKPHEGDATRLFEAYDTWLSDPATRRRSKFILYRVLLAITTLNADHRILDEDAGKAKSIAHDCLLIADPDLRTRATAVASLFN